MKKEKKPKLENNQIIIKNDIEKETNEKDYLIAYQFVEQELLETEPNIRNEELSNNTKEILMNYIKYGRNVNDWLEFGNEINRENIQEIINIFPHQFRMNEIVLKSIFRDRIEKILNDVKKGFYDDKKYIINDFSINSVWKKDIDIELFNEIIEKGNDLFEEYLENWKIRKFIIKSFGIKTKDKQIDVLKLRIHSLMLYFNTEKN